MESQATKLPVTGRVNTWADVLAENGKTQQEFDQEWSGRQDYDIATEQCRLISLALNEGTEMKTADTSQWKYFPVFDVIPDPEKPAGFGLSFDGDDGSCTDASVGARLGFKEPRLARHAGTKFPDIYQRALV